MNKAAEIAEDIYKRNGGALLSVKDIMDYCSVNRDTAMSIVAGMGSRKDGIKKQYYYKDVARAIVGRIAL